MSLMRKPTLLLTATIRPPDGVPALSRIDPAARLRDYQGALRFYRGMLGKTFHSIVFAENSSSDLTALREETSGLPVEFVSTQQDHPPAYGRGYGEMRLIEHAMAASTLLREAPVVWKCTGRYQLLNIADLVSSRPDVDLYVHCRDYPHRLCELFSMSFSRRGFDAVLSGSAAKLRNDLVPGVHSNEEVSFRQIIDAQTQVSVRKRFRHTPIIAGVRGWDQSQYSSALSPKIMARRVMNRLTPWIWV